ncbi:hypothetical protein CSW78_28270, partial [Shigella flexneri]
GKFKTITGIEHVDRLIDIDQSPIGRTPRSNPATYTGVFDDIRDFFEIDSNQQHSQKSHCPEAQP